MSLNDSRSLSRLVLKESRLSASVRSLGNMFLSRGPLGGGGGGFNPKKPKKTQTQNGISNYFWVFWVFWGFF